MVGDGGPNQLFNGNFFALNLGQNVLQTSMCTYRIPSTPESLGLVHPNFEALLGVPRVRHQLPVSYRIVELGFFNLCWSQVLLRASRPRLRPHGCVS